MDNPNTTVAGPIRQEPGGDLRRRDFFMVDNPVVDRCIDRIDPKRRADAGWLYVILCRKAHNDTRDATLGLTYLMEKTGRSKPILIDALKALRDVGLILIHHNRSQGHQARSTYTILEVPRVKPHNPEADVQGKQDLPVEGGPGLTDFTASNKDLVSTDTKVTTPETNVSSVGEKSPRKSNYYMERIRPDCEALGVPLDEDDALRLGKFIKARISKGASDKELIAFSARYPTRRKEWSAITPSQAWADINAESHPSGRNGQPESLRPSKELM